MKVPVYKQREVETLKRLITDYPVIALVDVKGIPANQLRQIRNNLKPDAVLRIAKKTLLSRALREAVKEESVEEFIGKMEGQIALIATSYNPFKLYRTLEATKTRTFAKGGEIAPEDIVVQEGETDFKPGPIVGELQKAGIPAGIVSGKVVIKSTKTIVKAGDKIPQFTAAMLTRLGIAPLTIGLNLRAVYDNGTVYLPDMLRIDEDEVMGNLASAYQQAMSLAMEIAYPTPQTIGMLLSKAHSEALSLCQAAGIYTTESVRIMLAQANARAATLKTVIEGGEIQTPSQPDRDEEDREEKEKKDAEEEKKGEASETDVAAGLGALFG